MLIFKLLVFYLFSLLVNAEYLGNYQCNGDADVFVHLFEWKWSDIANECEQILAPAGYCGVQVKWNGYFLHLFSYWKRLFVKYWFTHHEYYHWVWSTEETFFLSLSIILWLLIIDKWLYIVITMTSRQIISSYRTANIFLYFWFPGRSISIVQIQ